MTFNPRPLPRRIWQTVADVDFTSFAAQSLAADGNYTLGPYAFVRQNSAGDASPLVITPSGLRFTPTGTTEHNAGVRTAPLLGLYLGNIEQRPLTTGWGVRIWARIATSNHAALGDSALLGLDADADWEGFVAGRGYRFGLPDGIGAQYTSEGSAGAVNAAITSAFSSKVIRLTIPEIGGRDWELAEFNDATTWPFDSQMRTRIRRPYALPYEPPENVAAYNALVWLGAQRAGSSTAFETVFSRMRVDVVTPIL